MQFFLSAHPHSKTQNSQQVKSGIYEMLCVQWNEDFSRYWQDPLLLYVLTLYNTYNWSFAKSGWVLLITAKGDVYPY